MKFYEEKDLAYCGLACVLCSEEACPGCKSGGCREASNCSVLRCVKNKGLEGCYLCEEYPCEEKMLQGNRIRAFNRYAKEYGKQELLRRLKNNYEEGIVYHKPNGLKGDYDEPDSEEEILQLLQYGNKNPYRVCPVFETEHFLLRLVARDDAAELLTCYSDVNSRMLFNSDNCIGNFSFESEEKILECINAWLGAYARREFVRLSIVDKNSGKAVGTIEMFGKIGRYNIERGILRLDIASKYEKEGYLKELFSLCIKEFFKLFAVKLIVTKAIPEAVTRINTLRSLGFIPYDFPEREHYWAYSAEMS